MKQNLIMAAFIAAATAACATPTGQTPEEARIARIQRACVIDAGLRPVVDSLLLTSDATPEDIATVEAARAIIDPICANPTGDVTTNMQTAFYGATGKILGIYTRLANAQVSAAK